MAEKVEQPAQEAYVDPASYGRPASGGGHITERADTFAKKLRPPKVTDERGEDEKLAAFYKKYDSHAAVKEAREKAAARRGK